MTADRRMIRVAMCGPDFFDDLIIHPEVEKACERWLDGAFLRQGHSLPSFHRLRSGAVPILRVPGTGREQELNERQLDAKGACMGRCRLWVAVQARRAAASGTLSVCSGA